ncbi:MAG: hypothetical protein IJI14_00745 [Anaerolineaceae bacterium]|nr:hypothetical protein [Anaerolineaceae bacterium]
MDWKKRTILYYALGGFLIGILAGIISVNNAVEKNKEVDLSLKNGAKVGIAALDAMQKIVMK